MINNNSDSNDASSTYITDSSGSGSGTNQDSSSGSGSGETGSGSGSGSDPNSTSLASSKDYTYSTTFSDSLDPSSSFGVDYTTSSSNFYSFNSSDYTQEGMSDPSKSHSIYTDSNNNNFSDSTSSQTYNQNFFDPSSSNSGGGSGSDGYQADTYSSSDGCIYYNLSSSTNPDDTDSSNILSSVMTESLFFNSDTYPNIDSPENYFNHLIKPIRILDSKCSSRKGQRPSKFEPHTNESLNCLEKPVKYNQIENFFITELQEWLSNSRIGTDLSSDIFNYIILNEIFDITYRKLKKWIISLDWSAYDAQEIDKRVKEMKLLEEEMNYLKS